MATKWAWNLMNDLSHEIYGVRASDNFAAFTLNLSTTDAFYHTRPFEQQTRRFDRPSHANGCNVVTTGASLRKVKRGFAQFPHPRAKKVVRR